MEELEKVIEKAIRRELITSTGELTEADLEEMTKLNLLGNRLTGVWGLLNLTQLEALYLDNNPLTHVEGLEKLTQLRDLRLKNNQLTDVKGLEKLAQLRTLNLRNNPALTKAQIAQLQKALPKCLIHSNPKK